MGFFKKYRHKNNSAQNNTANTYTVAGTTYNVTHTAESYPVNRSAPVRTAAVRRVQKPTTSTPPTATTSKLNTIEAEVSRYLNISWADARDLVSYARGKHNVLPGDKNAEKIKRYAIIQSAIEADAHNPKKKLAPKLTKPKLSIKEQEKQDRIQKWARDHYHATWGMEDGDIFCTGFSRW